MAGTGIEAGWYADPTEAALKRYWDGSAWTEHTAANDLPVEGGQEVVLHEQAAAQPAVQPAYGGYQQQAYQAVPVAVVQGPTRKDPAVMLILSFFIPGLGSMLSGAGGMGAAILCTYIGSWFVLFIGFLTTFIFIGFLLIPIAFIMWLGAWIFGMFHAYSAAQKYNLQHGLAA